MIGRIVAGSLIALTLAGCGSTTLAAGSMPATPLPLQWSAWGSADSPRFAVAATKVTVAGTFSCPGPNPHFEIKTLGADGSEPSSAGFNIPAGGFGVGTVTLPGRPYLLRVDASPDCDYSVTIK